MMNMSEEPMHPLMNAGFSAVLRGCAGNPGY